MKSPTYSVVVPVYRGRTTIAELCKRLAAFFDGRGSSFEIILVDDGSSDGSWDEILEIAESMPHVTGIQLMRNFGQHNATVCGFKHASGDFVITVDEDLQNPPEEIDKLIDCLEKENADVAYGIPEERQHSWWRKLGSRLVMIIPRYVMKISFDISAFRLIRASVAREAAKSLRHDVILDICLAWTTSRIVATPVRHMEDSSRGSAYSIPKLVSVFFNMLCNYTVMPLRISATAGAALALLSIAAGILVVILKLIGYIDEPGYTSIVISIFFSTGLILMSIGIVSEYLARIFLHVNQKPQFVIRNMTKHVDK